MGDCYRQLKECMEHGTLFLALSGTEADDLVASKAEKTLQKAMVEHGHVYICLLITAHNHVDVALEDVAARMQMPCIPGTTQELKEMIVEHAKDVPDALVQLCKADARSTDANPMVILTDSVGCSIKNLARNLRM